MKKPGGRICIGYRPLTGHPRDADGKLLLHYEYASAPTELPQAVELPAPRVRARQGSLI